MSQTVAELLTSPAPASATPDIWRRDLEVLIAHTLSVNRAWLIAHAADPVPEKAQATIEQQIAARAAGRPVAYLTGEREFWSLSLQVTEDTLIPRPETEHLVERALFKIPPGVGARVLDIGTGSGAIALALKHERPEADLTGSDVSPAALAVARTNGERLGLAVTWLCGDALGPVTGVFDVIVSNPPYIESGDPCLRGGDLRFEPLRALSGGPDGLDIIRRIAHGAPRHLAPGGLLIFEHGAHQQEAVTALLARYGYREIETTRDLAGHARITEAIFGPPLRMTPWMT